ncbi:hypothetical protein TTHERM_00930730 (macronuclear) [Tetrahymena thermophila SB210]|uniref:Uncharacterized protein n=1 Tax=Tetrahymena thermophila (strain SB210) TaxID=312017 RepID=Q24CG8_TETTS|nr:hypothetical protein TTHERM_00930730 [Tetrahymena thermophila SB210]EAS05492.2 hypothetical protein TTHERM_00930730 [Tetrahymena thermophila SB210]|eukprot:XP_001025737.2 hypothetical protein TTHERM_00930730 [Tetrahymena thermophila SB210]
MSNEFCYCFDSKKKHATAKQTTTKKKKRNSLSRLEEQPHYQDSKQVQENKQNTTSIGSIDPNQYLSEIQNIKTIIQELRNDVQQLKEEKDNIEEQKHSQFQNSPFASNSTYQYILNPLKSQTDNILQQKMLKSNNIEYNKQSSQVRSSLSKQSFSFQSVKDAVREYKLNDTAFNILKGQNDQQEQIQPIVYESTLNSKNVLELQFKIKEVNYKMYAQIKNQDYDQNYLHDKLQEYQNIYLDNEQGVVETKRFGKEFLEYLILNVTTKKDEVCSDPLMLQFE